MGKRKILADAPAPTIIVSKIMKFSYNGVEFDTVDDVRNYVEDDLHSDFQNGDISLSDLINKLTELEAVCKTLSK